MGERPRSGRVLGTGNDQYRTAIGILDVDGAGLTELKLAKPAWNTRLFNFAIAFDPHPPFDAGARSKGPKPIDDMAVAAPGE